MALIEMLEHAAIQLMGLCPATSRSGSCGGGLLAPAKGRDVLAQPHCLCRRQIALRLRMLRWTRPCQEPEQAERVGVQRPTCGWTNAPASELVPVPGSCAEPQEYGRCWRAHW